MNIGIWLTNQDINCLNFSDENFRKITAKIPQAKIFNFTGADAFKEKLPEFDVVLVWVFKQEWLEIAKRLKWIVTPAAGKDFFNIKLPEEIKIYYGTFHGEIMAETVVGMILASVRGIIDTCNLMKRYPWPNKEVEVGMRPLRGSNVVILGFGKIGQWTARLLKPFGVKITAVKRSLIEKPDYFDDDDSIITIDLLDTVLPTADHLVMILPRSKETNNIMNKKRINLLPSYTHIYNVGRGNSIDENALADALNNEKIAGACLDVYQTEPLPSDSPLRNAKNILLMPHASAFAPNYFDLFVDEFSKLYYKSINKG